MDAVSFNHFSRGLLLLLLCSLVCGGAGCRRNVKPPATTQTQAVLAQGGEVRLPLSLKLIDPALSKLDLSDHRLFALSRAVEMPLIRADVAGTALPGLASAWSSNADGSEWTLTLNTAPDHQDAPGYLGEQIKAAWGTILLGQDGPLKAQLADLVTGASDITAGRSLELSGVTIVGAELLIKLTRPNRLFPLWVSQPGLGLHGHTGASAVGKVPTTVEGYGPFRIQSQQGDTLQLVPNPSSLVGQPRLSRLTFVMVDDRDEQIAQLRAGTLHAANVSMRMGDTVETYADLQPLLKHHETAAAIVCAYDLHQFPWGDSKFQKKLGLRKSLNLVLDRGVLRELVGDSLAAWPHFFPQYYEQYVEPQQLQDPPYKLGQQIELAREEQKRADHEQGNKLLPGMDLGYLRSEDHEFLALNIIEYWNEISVKMQPFALTHDELALRVDNGTQEILLREIYPAYPAADALCYPVMHSALAGMGGNWSMLDDKEIDRLLESAQASDNPALLTNAYRDLSEKLEDESLFVFIGYATPKLVISPELGGYTLSAYDFDASLPAQDFTQLGLYETSDTDGAPTVDSR